MHNCIAIGGVISVNACITVLHCLRWCHISEYIHNCIAIVGVISVSVCITVLLALVLYQ